MTGCPAAARRHLLGAEIPLGLVWLAAFLAGQTTPAAVATAKRFLRTAKLDPDLRRKVLERLDGVERTVRIRRKYG